MFETEKTRSRAFATSAISGVATSRSNPARVSPSRSSEQVTRQAPYEAMPLTSAAARRSIR
jgi:hypothetical protein